MPAHNQVELWNLPNDIMLHKVEKEKLPKLNQNWSEYYLNRFEERLPSKLKNKHLNFYVPYEKLKDIEKPHFIPEQKISIRKILEADETENIKQQKYMYIYDGIFQVVREEIDQYVQYLQEVDSESDVADSLLPEPLHKSLSFGQYGAVRKSNVISQQSSDDLALLQMYTIEEDDRIVPKVCAFDDLDLVKRSSNPLDQNSKKPSFKKRGSVRIDLAPSPLIRSNSGTDDIIKLGNAKEFKKGLLEFSSGLDIIKEKADNLVSPKSKAKADPKEVNLDSPKLIQENKTQDLAKLYEFDTVDDQDPFYEVYNCHTMTFIETICSKSMNHYIRVDQTPCFKISENVNQNLEECDFINISKIWILMFR